jgi:hypothetical protein
MSKNLTLETLASKGINDSSVSGATIKDALETLELATNGSGKVYAFTGTITALTTGQALTLNGDPDALLDFDHDLIYLGKVGYWEVTGAVLGTAFVANLSGGPFFAYFNNPGVDTQSSIFIAGNNQTVYANGTASTGSIQFTPTEVSADKWRFICTDNTCTENCEVTFYIFVDTILNPATGAITTPNAGAGGLTDGTYGDIAVSGSGTNLQIVGGAVGTSELANNAVTDAKINTGAVTLPKIGATGAGAGKVLTTDGTTMTWETPAGGLDDGDYGDITVSGGGTVMSIDAGVVTVTELADNAVTYAKLNDSAVDTNKIANNAVTDVKLNNSAVTTNKLADDAVTYAKMQDINSGKVLGRLSSGSGNVEELNLGIIPLVTTFADCENTTSEIDIVTVTIPANTLAVGDMIEIDYYFQRLQDSGGSVTFNKFLKLNSAKFNESNGSTLGTSTILYDLFHKEKFIVTLISSNIATIKFIESANLTISSVQSIYGGISATTSANGARASTNFSNNTLNITNSNTLTIATKWFSANVNRWVRVQQAQAYIIKKAV